MLDSEFIASGAEKVKAIKRKALEKQLSQQYHWKFG